MKRVIVLLFLLSVLVISTSIVGFASKPIKSTNVALRKPVEVSSFRDSYSGERVVDGIWNTRESRWVSGTTGRPPHYLVIDLEGTFVIDSAEVWTGDPTTGNQHVINNFKLQYWNGNQWVDIPGASVKNNQSELVFFTFTEQVMTDRVRFYYDEPSGVIRVREILVYGIPHVEDLNLDLDGPDLSVVRDGEAQAVIVIPNGANLRIVGGANTIAQYVKKSTGAQLSVMTEKAYESSADNFTGFTRIFIGDGFEDRTYDDAVNKALINLDNQGFVILSHDHSIRIVGPTVWGTLNGVHDFLERYVGVRWIMIGPAGEDVPDLTDIDVPVEIVREQPAYTFRQIHPFTGGDPYNPFTSNRVDQEWAHRNRLQGNYNFDIEFSHNLYRIFPPEIYGKTNPEFYPGSNPPEPGDIRRWQPCFSVDATVDVAVDHIIRYFDENPDAPSFSLSTNDIGGFCEERRSHPQYPGEWNSSGYMHLSEVYYEWVNKVVGRVTEVYPDKWFGLSAYREVMDPPSFPLHPRVIPFITKDRMTWIDDDVRSAGHHQMEQWNKVANQVAWYDYMYGFMYHVPRPFPRLLAETLSYGSKNNVIGFYTETHYHAGEGPKGWIIAKLLWNPDQDIEALLQQWYERAVGPKAAIDLAAFFDYWERFWMERIPGTPWFESGKHSTYLSFPNQSYLASVTEEDLIESIRLLDSVIEKAETDLQKERAKMFRRSFDFYEAATLSFPTEVVLPAQINESADFIDRYVETVRERIEMAERRYELLEEFRHDLDRNMRMRVSLDGVFFDYWWTDWTGWNPLDFEIIANHLRIHEPAGGLMTDRIDEMTQSSDDFTRTFAYLFKMYQGAFIQSPSLTVNSSFEEEHVEGSPWRYVVDAHGTFKRAEGISRSGDASLKADRIRSGHISQLFNFRWGMTGAQIHYFTPSDTKTGTIQLELHGKNARGQTVMSVTTPAQSLSLRAGEWSSLQLIDVLSSGTRRTDITQAEIVVTIEGAQNTEVFIDDVVVYQNVQLGATVKPGPPPVGRPNIALGKPTSASSYNSDGTSPDRAVDGDLTSRWFTQTGTSDPHWLEVDLQGTFVLDSAEVWTGVVGQTGPYSIGHIKLQYWTELGWEDIPGAAISGNREELVSFRFAQTVITSKVRFYSETKESPDGLGLRFREILIYGTPYSN